MLKSFVKPEMAQDLFFYFWLKDILKTEKVQIS